jgi:hypothetical protein
MQDLKPWQKGIGKAIVAILVSMVTLTMALKVVKAKFGNHPIASIASSSSQPPLQTPPLAPSKSNATTAANASTSSANKGAAGTPVASGATDTTRSNMQHTDPPAKEPKAAESKPLVVSTQAPEAPPADPSNPLGFVSVQRADGLEYGITRCEHEPQYRQIVCEGLVRNIGDEPKALSFKEGGSTNDDQGNTAQIYYGNIKYSYNGDLIDPGHFVQFMIKFDDPSRGHSTSVEIKLRARWSVDEHTRPGDLLPLEVPLTPTA